MPPKGQEGIMSFGPPKAPKKLLFFFFRKCFWVHPKNSGLNPWSFQFWGYPRLGPRRKLAPLKPAAGSASAEPSRSNCRARIYVPIMSSMGVTPPYSLGRILVGSVLCSLSTLLWMTKRDRSFSAMRPLTNSSTVWISVWTFTKLICWWRIGMALCGRGSG